MIVYNWNIYEHYNKIVINSRPALKTCAHLITAKIDHFLYVCF